MGFILSCIILAFFILFHELGHFLVARLCGVKVEVFSIGFGKKIFTFTYRGTQYAISAIPLGGYVQLKGQQEAFTQATQPKRESTNKGIIHSHSTEDLQAMRHSTLAPADSYLVKSPIQRIAILLAGSFFNILLGFLLYLYVCLHGLESVPPIVGEVLDSTPAQEARMIAGDRILAINGVEVRTWDELSKRVQDSKGEITLNVQRDLEHMDIILTPHVMQSRNIFGEVIEHNAIGILATQQTQIIRYTGLQAITKAWEKTIEASRFIMQSLQKLLSGVVGAQNVSSIVGITHAMSAVAQSDMIAFLTLSALISINLGIFNLLPIPPLDGGHILLTLYQAIMRRSLHINIINGIVAVGLTLLLGIMALGIFNDINRIIAP